MKRRQRPTIPSSGVEQNLDSFLDILTNTVGILMFIGVFVSLVAVEASTIVRTPLVKESNKTSYLIELRNNSLIDLEHYFPIVQNKLDTFIQTLPNCVEPTRPRSNSLYALERYADRVRDYRLCQRRIARKASNFNVVTKHYKVNFDFKNSAEIYKVKNQQKGESPEALEKVDSNFQELLSELDPEKDYLAFIVRPDSFPVFRKARKIAWEKGFEVGWEPYPTQQPIIFGSNGRRINTQ